MKILVTGATGYLGSYLVLALLDQGNDVVILKRSFSDTCRIKSVLSELQTYNIDECSIEKPFIDCRKIDAVIHVATCYGRQQETLKYIVDSNSSFPLQLLDTAVAYRVPAFYNTDTVLPKYINEYALSKKHFGEWGRFFAHKGSIRFVNIKLAQMYGPLDDKCKFPASIMYNCLRNTPQVQLTEGKQTRDFIFVTDIISAYLTLLANTEAIPEQCQEYELGSDQVISIRNFVELVHHFSNSQTILEFGAIPYRLGEVMELRADTTALRAVGWSPKIRLTTGIKICLQKEDAR